MTDSESHQILEISEEDEDQDDVQWFCDSIQIYIKLIILSTGKNPSSTKVFKQPKSITPGRRISSSVCSKMKLQRAWFYCR